MALEVVDGHVVELLRAVANFISSYFHSPPSSADAALKFTTADTANIVPYTDVVCDVELSSRFACLAASICH